MGETRILSNGAVYDMDKKRIVANPGGGTKAITQANASELAHKRWQDQRDAFASGLVRAVEQTGQMPNGATGEAGAWSVFAEKAGTLMLDENDSRKYATIMDSIANHAGWSKPRGEAGTDSTPPMQRALTALAHELVETLRDVLHERGESPAVQVIDIEPG